MAAKIEDYGLIGDCQSAALVSSSGSIDWLCLPRFDSGACFAALMGKADNGFWSLAPSGETLSCERAYLPDTLILRTVWTTRTGQAEVLDFMPVRGKYPDVVRMVRGISGEVAMRTEFVLRFDYGSVVPWVTARKGGLDAVAGPDKVRLVTPVPLEGEDLKTKSLFTVKAGEAFPFVLTWYPSHDDEPAAVAASDALKDTLRYWSEWTEQAEIGDALKAKPRWRDAVQRSLITLKAMTYAPTGAICAAVTTSLPEEVGGSRNWDYRYCWLRDASLTLGALARAGYRDEATGWYRWLLRAVAGTPAQIQIMYGLSGERRLPEQELSWLTGYEDSRPVRIGNGAADQLQLDVYGEVVSALRLALLHGLKPCDEGWSFQVALLEHLMQTWRSPDEGIWEVRGGPRHFTFSKVMAWVAFDCAIAVAKEHALEAPLPAWESARDAIHAEICARGYDEELGTFVQSYASKELDASLLLLPEVGFLPATDPRMMRTIDAIATELSERGLVRRYHTTAHVDGVAGSEGVFLACSFWLARALSRLGRHDDADALFERLLSLRSDLGLLAEEYATDLKRQVGNFPQAFSHLNLVETAFQLAAARGSATDGRDDRITGR